MLTKTIFLIDDDEDDREIFFSALQEVANNVIIQTAINGEDALRQLNEKDIQPDIIFLDLNMPVMNGQQFLSRLKQKDALADIPVIVYTTTSDPASKQNVTALGAHSFITKPEKYSELIKLLKNLFSTSGNISR